MKAVMSTTDQELFH